MTDKEAKSKKYRRRSPMRGILIMSRVAKNPISIPEGEFRYSNDSNIVSV